MLEDTLLKIRFNRGDKDALCRIYEKYKDDLLKLALALLNDIALAEDVLNDSFVSFTESAGKLRLTGNQISGFSCSINCGIFSLTTFQIRSCLTSPYS